MANDNKNISIDGLRFIMNEEGFVPTRYKDQGGYAIGYGHTILPGEDFPYKITKSQAMQLLKKDCEKFETAIKNSIYVELNQNQFDALVSLIFNTGPAPLKGKLGKAINNNKFDLVPSLWKEWKNAGGKPILAGRRARELQVWSRDSNIAEPQQDSKDLLNKFYSMLSKIEKNKKAASYNEVLISGPSYLSNFEAARIISVALLEEYNITSNIFKDSNLIKICYNSNNNIDFICKFVSSKLNCNYIIQKQSEDKTNNYKKISLAEIVNNQTKFLSLKRV